MIFSEKSRRVIYEMDNMKLFELGQTSVTIQCHSCLQLVSDRFIFCRCGAGIQSWWDPVPDLGVQMV